MYCMNYIIRWVIYILNHLLWLVFSLAISRYILLVVQQYWLGRTPPGPMPLPIIGNILVLRKKSVRILTNLAKSYGPLMSLQLGQRKVIVVSSSSMAKEILQKQDTLVSARPTADAMRVENHLDYSVICLPSASTRWRTMRRLCSVGVFSGSSLEASQRIRRNKVEELIAHVRACARANEAVDIGIVAFTASLNFLSNTFFSRDLADHSSAAKFKVLYSGMSREMGRINISDFFPELRVLDPQGVRRRMGFYARGVKHMIDMIVDERLKQTTTTTTCSSLINYSTTAGSLQEDDDHQANINGDVLDNLIKFSRDQNSTNEFAISWITHILVDLFVAGTDTTSITIEWAMAELLRHPHKLRRAQEELDRVIGKGNLVKESDAVARLPYLSALVKETLRLHPAVAVFSRKVCSDFEVAAAAAAGAGSYRIPKDSHIWINLSAIGKDPSHWDNPDFFEPERFLQNDHHQIDINGKLMELIPFGAGRRICAGMPLAMRMIPLMLANLIHFFDWKLGNVDTIDMEEVLGTTLHKEKPLRVFPIIK